MRVLTFNGKTGEFKLDGEYIGDYIEVVFMGGEYADVAPDLGPNAQVFTCNLGLTFFCDMQDEPEEVKFMTHSKLSWGVMMNRHAGEKLVLTPSSWRYTRKGLYQAYRYCALCANGFPVVGQP